MADCIIIINCWGAFRCARLRKRGKEVKRKSVPTKRKKKQASQRCTDSAEVCRGAHRRTSYVRFEHRSAKEETHSLRRNRYEKPKLLSPPPMPCFAGTEYSGQTGKV